MISTSAIRRTSSRERLTPADAVKVTNITGVKVRTTRRG